MGCWTVQLNSYEFCQNSVTHKNWLIFHSSSIKQNRNWWDLDVFHLSYVTRLGCKNDTTAEDYKMKIIKRQSIKRIHENMLKYWYSGFVKVLALTYDRPMHMGNLFKDLNEWYSNSLPTNIKNLPSKMMHWVRLSTVWLVLKWFGIWWWNRYNPWYLQDYPFKHLMRQFCNQNVVNFHRNVVKFVFSGSLRNTVILEK